MAKDKTAFKIAFLTAASIFVMGYLNGLAVTGGLGAVTPQSGNVINIGLNAAAGNWQGLIRNLALFLGFIGGAIFALFTNGSIKNKTSQFLFNWSIFALPIAFFPLYHEHIDRAIALLIVGFTSGAALGYFRKMYHLDINNAMATGNVRLLGINFAEAFLRGKKKEMLTFTIFLICVLGWALGAFCFGIAHRLDESGLAEKIALAAACLIPYLFAPPKN